MDEAAAYFERRAAEEIAMAQRSENPAAVKAHYEMAKLYLERAEALREHARSAVAR